MGLKNIITNVNIVDVNKLYCNSLISFTYPLFLSHLLKPIIFVTNNVITKNILIYENNSYIELLDPPFDNTE